VSFQQQNGTRSNVLLGGRNWKVKTIDWRRRLAFVEPTGETGRSRWFGSSRGLQFNLVQAMERALVHWESPVALSRRAVDRLGALSNNFHSVMENRYQSWLVTVARCGGGRSPQPRQI
jgi:ATP-dependent Lhr-like helicase